MATWKHIRKIDEPTVILGQGYFTFENPPDIPDGYELVEGLPPKDSTPGFTDPLESVRKEFMKLPTEKQLELAPTLQLGLFFIEQNNPETMEALAKNYQPKDEDEANLLSIIKKHFDIKDE